MVKIHEWIEWALFKDISALNSRCEMFKNSQNNSKQSVSCWRSDMSDWQILMAGCHQVQLLMWSTFAYILTHFWVSRGHNQKNEKSLHHDVNPNPVNLPTVSPTVRPTERLKHAIHGCYPTSKRSWMEGGKIFDVGFSVASIEVATQRKHLSFGRCHFPSWSVSILETMWIHGLNFEHLKCRIPSRLNRATTLRP